MEVRTDQTQIRQLGLIQKSTDDLRPIWQSLHDNVFIKLAKKAFETEGQSTRLGQWKPLNKKYEAYKKKYSKYDRILKFSGRLFASVLSPRDGLFDKIFISKPQSMALGTEVPYAYPHLLGGATIPQRSWTAYTDDQNREFEKEFQKKMNDTVAKIAGRRVIL